MRKRIEEGRCGSWGDKFTLGSLGQSSKEVQAGFCGCVWGSSGLSAGTQATVSIGFAVSLTGHSSQCSLGIASVKLCLLRGPDPPSAKHFVLLSPQERIRLARQVEKAEYRNFQACLHNSWMEQAAAALEIELEEEMYKGVPGQGGKPVFGVHFPFILSGRDHPSVSLSGAARCPLLVS